MGKFSWQGEREGAEFMHFVARHMQQTWLETQTAITGDEHKETQVRRNQGLANFPVTGQTVHSLGFESHDLPATQLSPHGTKAAN